MSKLESLKIIALEDSNLLLDILYIQYGSLWHIMPNPTRSYLDNSKGCTPRPLPNLKLSSEVFKIFKYQIPRLPLNY